MKTMQRCLAVQNSTLHYLLTRLRVCLGALTPLVVVLLWAGLAAPTHAAITYDAVSSASAGTVSSFSWVHTVGSGNDRMLVVGIAAERTSDQWAASVTYGAQSMTLVPGSQASQSAPYN